MMLTKASVSILGFLALCNLSVCTADGCTTYDAAAGPCFMTFNNSTRGPGGSQAPTPVRADDFIRAFEAGVDGSCAKLTTLLGCVEAATVGCDTSVNATSKRRYDKMKEITKYVCVTKFTEFNANAPCISGQPMKDALAACQTHLTVDKFDCGTLTATVDCTDAATHAHCPAVEASFGHLMRVYLVARLDLETCAVAPPGDKSAGVSTAASTARLLTGLTLLLTGLHLLTPRGAGFHH
jgi:hypothetical protein